MRKKFKYLSIVLFGISLFACSSNNSSDDDEFTPQNFNVRGKVEKGPFVSGSTVTLQPMDENMQPSGDTYTASIEDNAGNFSFGSKRFEQRYAGMAANGYFFNETTGTLSNGTLNLRAVVDLSDKSSVNVNLLTHIKYQRIMHLVGEGETFAAANTQAQTELFTAFGLKTFATKAPETFSITAGTDEAAVLIAISSLILIDRSEAQITEYLAKLCKEFGENGTFSNDTYATMAEDKTKLQGKLEDISNNIVNRYSELGQTVSVKSLEPFIDWDNDGTAGNETLKDGETVTLTPSEISVPNSGGKFEVKITSPIPVYLTAKGGGNISEEVYEDMGLYDNTGNKEISTETSINGDVLTITVAQLNSRAEKTSTVTLYDVMGNSVASVTLTQEGNPDASGEKPGESTKAMASSYALSMLNASTYLNLIEQCYYYNKEDGTVDSSVRSKVSNAWSNYYSAIRTMQSLKQADARCLNSYQDYCNVFTAMAYYYLTTCWGDVPYIQGDMGALYDVSRTSYTTILNDAKIQLKQAINTLEEKKNNSLSDASYFFLVSKDVARILLAEIYMYQNDYSNALPLLKTVISNGYYSLDASNYSDKNTLDKIKSISNGTVTLNSKRRKASTRSVTGDELIFVLVNNSTRSTRSINQTNVIPLMNYTDVVLLYSECLYKTGNSTSAKKYLSDVTTAKNITVSSDVFTGIKEAREKLLLYSVGNFQFMKRNGIAVSEYGISDYQQLLPIPSSELTTNSNITQNPGW